MLERACTLGGCPRRYAFPAWVAQVIHAAAALAGDDSPGRQCTEMMSYVCNQACGAQDMVNNAGQVDNVRNGCRCHFIGL